jgi:hypothetical protein
VTKLCKRLTKSSCFVCYSSSLGVSSSPSVVIAYSYTSFYLYLKSRPSEIQYHVLQIYTHFPM